MVQPRLTDRNWAKRAFFMGTADNLETVDQKAMYFSTAELKFTDTSLGGNFAINPLPQFTDSADIPVVGRLLSGKGVNEQHSGMGRAYSEAFDDNQQLVHFRFGVPEFNSLTRFFSGFYNSEAASLAKGGRGTLEGAFYWLGRAIGFIATLRLWPLQLFMVGVNFFIGKPRTKFYYLKPSMPTYLMAVTNIVNQIAVNKNLIPRVFDEKTKVEKLLQDSEFGMSVSDAADFSKKMPDIFKENGGIDIYAVTTRAARLARKQDKRFEQLFNENIESVPKFITDFYSASITDERPDFNSYLKRWVLSELGNTANSSPKNGLSSESVPDPGNENLAKGTPSTDEEKAGQGVMSRTWDYLKSELDDGGAFVSFRVDATGAMSESFSNTVGESELSSKINSISSQSRSTNFNLAGGNVSGLLTPIVDVVKGLITGVADQLEISGILTLAGAAFVDIPQHWQSSAASLPRANYTIKLVSPYGNPMSQMMNIYIPLAYLLAAVLPISTGPHSYTSPFLCEFYDRGRCQSRLGIIDSMTITRGTTNLAFNKEGEAMGIEVSFSVVDLSSVMHMPISDGFTINPATALFSDDSAFTDYMAILSSLSLPDQIYTWRKFKLNITKQMAHWDSWFSASHFASWGANTPPGRLISGFYKGIEKF